MIRALLFGVALALVGVGAHAQTPTASAPVVTVAPTPAVTVPGQTIQPVTAAPAPAVVVPSSSFLNVGAAFGKLQPYVESIVGSLLSLAIGWLFFLARTKLNLSIDQSHRDALAAFLLRQASSLVADGFVKVTGLKVQVDSAALRNAALLGEQVVGDAVKFFGLSPANLAERIVDKLPQVPAVAAAMSADTVATATVATATTAAVVMAAGR